MTGHAHRRNQRDRLAQRSGSRRSRRPAAAGQCGARPARRRTARPPIKLDVRGFPIARRSRTIVERLARLLNPSHPEIDEEGGSCPTSTAPAAS